MTLQERVFHDFAKLAAKLKDDERSEAQTYLFHLLEAFGHDANTEQHKLRPIMRADILDGGVPGKRSEPRVPAVLKKVRLLK